MRNLFSVSIFVTFVVNVYSARILGLFPHAGKSHQMVFEPLLKRLAEKGHQMTVVSFFPLKTPPMNYTDVSLEGVTQLGLESVDLSIYENPDWLRTLPGIGRILNQLDGFHPLADMALSICKTLVHWPPLIKAFKQDYDLVIVENFQSDCMLGLLNVYGIKAPIVGLSSCPLLPWTPHRLGIIDNPAYIAETPTGFMHNMNFLERLENTFTSFYFTYWHRINVQMKEQEILEKHFGRRLTDLEDLAKQTNLVLVNTFFSLNGVRPLVPGVVEVGGMHLDRNRQFIPEYMERFLNESNEGVVLFSLGSLIRTSTIPKYKEDMIINALGKLRQRVIWKYEDSDEKGTLIGNILKVRWIPQYELLNHKKVLAFIGHGGLLGMTETIAAGKPMVVMPFFGDQPLNGRAAEEAGFGKVLPYEDITEESFLNAIRTVLSAEKRLAARRASAMWHDRPAKPIDTAIYWTERVLRWGPESPLHSPARDLTFIERNLIDVIAVFLLAITILGFLLIYIVSLIPKIFLGTFSREGKKKVH